MKKIKIYIEMTNEERRNYFKYIVKDKFVVLDGAIDDFPENVYETKNEKAYKSWIHNLLQLKKFKVYDAVTKYPILSSLRLYIEWYNSIIKDYGDSVHIDISLLHSLYKYTKIKDINSAIYPNSVCKYLYSKEIQDILIKFSIENTYLKEVHNIHIKLKEFNNIQQYTRDFDTIDLYDIKSKCNKNGKYNKINEICSNLKIDKNEFILFLNYRKTFFNDVDFKNNGWFKFV